ncbi:MAG: ribosome biogenesis GTPase Der, partial [Myxococcota bacterium]
GKSTLFNRLVGRRIAIVEDVEGVTRDRNYADARVYGREYVLIDTGGFDPESDDPMREGIVSHVRLALEECDLVICVLDAASEATQADREAVHLLRQGEKPVLWVANKAESFANKIQSSSLYELGVDTIFPVSALHGNGVGDLEEALANGLPAEQPVNALSFDRELPRVAIVGRPNAGKSSLLNRLLKDERQLVDDRPGTTVDSIDALVPHEEGPLVVIDTAGIRRKRAVKRKGGVEALSVVSAIRAMERSDLVVLMIDANEGIAEQDAKIAGLAEERGRALVIGLNKTDLLDSESRKRLEARTREVLAFAPWAPMVHLSAKSGRGVERLLQTCRRIFAEHRKRISTAKVNRFFEQVLETHPPPTHHHRPVRLYYITQARASPPTFVVSTNRPEGVHFSYKRYVVNQLRRAFGFEGTPVFVRYRGKN